MSRRYTQLGNSLCEQDKIILNLFAGESVKYHGGDPEFAQHLQINEDSTNLVLILNRPLWCSDIIKECRFYLNSTIKKFYIGINRYCILGNDTNAHVDSVNGHGNSIIAFVSMIAQMQGFNVTQTGKFDNDQGRYFNFVQPLTWVYGTNQSN